MPFGLRTATNESQSSLPSTSTGSVTGRASSASSEIGISAAIASQSFSTSPAARPTTSSRARSVISSAERFQKRSLPSPSTIVTPSPTASSTRAACSRAAAVASARALAAASACACSWSRALRTAAAIRHARPLLVRQLAQVALAVDVVVDPGRILDLLRHVVLEQRLSAHDHTALHSTALAVQRQRRQDRWIELLAVDPGVVAADQLRLGVEGRDDHAVVRHRFDQQLAEAVVDALELERLVQITSRRQQQLCFLGPPMTAHVVVHHASNVRASRAAT